MLNVSLWLGSVLVLSAGCSGRYEQLAASGQWHAILVEIPPGSARGYLHRARAWRALGELDQARLELRLALALEPRSSAAHASMAQIERALGNRGAELRHLRRAVALSGGSSGERRRLSALVSARAKLAAETKGAARAAPIDPRCPGPPPIDPLRPLPVEGCALTEPAALAARARDGYLLLACDGPRTALELERAGCLSHALGLWRELAAENPRDIRWLLEVARVELARGRIERAELRLVDYRFAARDRCRASLLVARLLELAGQRRRAARVSLEAFSLARDPRIQLEVVGQLFRLGYHAEARQAVRVARATTLGTLKNRAERERLDRAFEAILGAPAPPPEHKSR